MNIKAVRHRKGGGGGGGGGGGSKLRERSVPRVPLKIDRSLN